MRVVVEVRETQVAAHGPPSARQRRNFKATGPPGRGGDAGDAAAQDFASRRFSRLGEKVKCRGC